MTQKPKPRKRTQHTILLDTPEPVQSEIPLNLPESEPQSLGDLTRDDDDWK